MPATAQPTRASGSAFCLAGIGGCVDALGVLTLGGLFVSHMSGNSAAFGADFGQGGWAAGWPHLLAIPIFVFGVFLGYFWILPSPTLRRCAWILFAEAALLAAFGALLWGLGSPVRNSWSYYGLASLPLLAMGIQNATLRQVERSAFPTTYMTGVLDAFGKASAQVLLAAQRRARGENVPGVIPFATMMHTSGLWGSYVAGALTGSAMLLFVREAACFLPVAALVIIGVRFYRSGNTRIEPESERDSLFG